MYKYMCVYIYIYIYMCVCVLCQNSSPSMRVLQKTNVTYQFKYILGDCI